MSETQTLLAEVESFMCAKQITPTRFGLLAVNDPRFVIALKAGRSSGPGISIRVRNFMRAMAGFDLRPERDRTPKQEPIRIPTDDDAMIREGSEKLLRALWKQHPQILRNLAKRGLQVKYA